VAWWRSVHRQGIEALSNRAAGSSTDLPYAYPIALHIPAHVPLFRRHTALGEEIEGALTVLGDRLSASGPRHGDVGDASA